MNKRIIIIACVFGILAVILGAFGAHGLKKLISAEQLAVWETAVQYQFYHTLGMLFLATFSRFKSRAINAASWFFTFGILLFSGSLYLMATKDLLSVTYPGFLGPLTPVGGLFFILGWLSLLIATVKNR